MKICLHLSVFNWIKSPSHLFVSSFFDEEVVNFMVDMTNLYAASENKAPNFTTDANEMRLLLAMLLLTDYNQLLRRKMYW